jgi:hypothetical protein
MIAIFVLLLLFAIGGLAFFLRRPPKREVFPRHEEKPLLTKNEAILFGRLCRALPDCYIFPQVALSALVEPAEADQKRKLVHVGKIAGLRVDYAVYGGDLELICAVVLESDTPDVGKNPLVERCLKSASIKVLRWSAATKPSVEQIGRMILPLTNNAKYSLEAGNTLNPNTIQRIHRADPIPSNIQGLSPEQLDELSPDKVLSTKYPHIWQRICLFAPEPKHLQKYLLSLSIQDRGEKRAGFPIEALKEIADIQMENERFLLQPMTGWQPAFINR